jgi:hypothetical protein
MRKTFFLITAFFLTLSACSPAVPSSQATGPAPLSETDLQATVAVQVEQTIQSLPTPTLAPSNTPMVITATSVATQTQEPTETQNPILLTLTATLGTGTATTDMPGALLFTATPNPALSRTPIGTDYFQYAGTMPPNLPSGHITLINLSKVAVSIALRCETKDGYVTYIDYPVGGSTVSDKIPAGTYTYVAWVGGKKSNGGFKLSVSQGVQFIIYKDRIEIK